MIAITVLLVKKGCECSILVGYIVTGSTHVYNMCILHFSYWYCVFCILLVFCIVFLTVLLVKMDVSALYWWTILLLAY